MREVRGYWIHLTCAREYTIFLYPQFNGLIAKITFTGFGFFGSGRFPF